MGPSIASRIPFHDLCNLCEKLSSSTREKRLAIFSKYVAFFRDFGDRMKGSEPDADASFFPVLRLLLPQLDRDRGAYGVKEHGLAKVLIRVLCLARDGQDAAKLLNFRAPSAAGAQAGDFAEVAFFVLKKRCSAGKTLTVEGVNACLDGVALKHAAHDARGVDDELTAVLKEMSAEEAKWLIRALLKNVKVGLGETALLNAFHPDAKSLYDVCNSLSKVCSTLHDPRRRLHEVEVSLFTPFRPMLAQMCDVREAAGVFTPAAPSYYLETKHDGERFQLHYANGVFHYFSKRGHDYTDVFGSTASGGGSLTPELSGCLRPDLRSCILDGEMMVWDRDLRAFRTKGDGVEARALRRDGPLRPCLCVFDMLLLDGDVLTARPLRERLALLEAAFRPLEGVLVPTERSLVSGAAEVEAAVDRAVDLKLEGVMLKEPASCYRPNARRGGWFKVKPEYSEGLADTVDALVVGGYYGEGRRRGDVSHFLLAAAVPPPDGEGGRPRRFVTLARVGSGYTDEELRGLLRRLAPHWTESRPPEVECARERPDVWLRPEASFLLQVKASEVTRSAAFAAGLTLRFPRVEAARTDKGWHEGVTTEDLAALALRLGPRRRVGDAAPINAPPPARRRAAPPTLGAQFAAADVSQLPRDPAAPLGGREVCVLSGGAGRTKQQVEADVHRKGGRLVQNPGPATWCLLGDPGGGARVTNAVRSGRWDVVRVSWLYSAAPEDLTAPWSPRDLLGATPATEAALRRRYDPWGDSYAAPVTEAALRELLDDVAAAPALDDLDLAEADVEVFGGRPGPFGFFRPCVAHFAGDPSASGALALDFVFFGGVAVPSVDEATTHVVVSGEAARGRWREENRRRSRKLHLVSEAWVREGVAKRRRLPEARY